MKNKNTFRFRVLGLVVVLFCAMVIIWAADTSYAEAAGPKFVGQTNAFLDPNGFLGFSFKENGLKPFEVVTFRYRATVIGILECDEGARFPIQYPFSGVIVNMDNQRADKNGQLDMPMFFLNQRALCPDNTFGIVRGQHYSNMSVEDVYNEITEYTKPETLDFQSN
jgi:hypothetical protein